MIITAVPTAPSIIILTMVTPLNNLKINTPTIIPVITAETTNGIYLLIYRHCTTCIIQCKIYPIIIPKKSHFPLPQKAQSEMRIQQINSSITIKVNCFEDRVATATNILLIKLGTWSEETFLFNHGCPQTISSKSWSINKIGKIKYSISTFFSITFFQNQHYQTWKQCNRS